LSSIWGSAPTIPTTTGARYEEEKISRYYLSQDDLWALHFAFACILEGWSLGLGELSNVVDRGILVQIRIRICGSVRTTDFGIRILLFSSVTDKVQTKNNFFSRFFFAYYFLKVNYISLQR
jgi:hypothetical protein